MMYSSLERLGRCNRGLNNICFDIIQELPTTDFLSLRSSLDSRRWTILNNLRRVR